MVHMIYGAAGALLALALVLLGFGLGWEACRVWLRRAREAEVQEWREQVREVLRLYDEMIREMQAKQADRETRVQPDSREVGEEQRREAEERQRAFESMLSYNAATAYGTEAALNELLKEHDR